MEKLIQKLTCKHEINACKREKSHVIQITTGLVSRQKNSPAISRLINVLKRLDS